MTLLHFQLTATTRIPPARIVAVTKAAPVVISFKDGDTIEAHGITVGGALRLTGTLDGERLNGEYEIESIHGEEVRLLPLK